MLDCDLNLGFDLNKMDSILPRCKDNLIHICHSLAVSNSPVSTVSNCLLFVTVTKMPEQRKCHLHRLEIKGARVLTLEEHHM